MNSLLPHKDIDFSGVTKKLGSDVIPEHIWVVKNNNIAFAIALF